MWPQVNRGASDKRSSLNAFTLLAYREDRMVGTLTVGVDAGNGLLVDEANQEMVDWSAEAADDIHTSNENVSCAS